MSDGISFAPFSTQATGYDPNNALLLAQLCLESYTGTCRDRTV